MAIGKGPGDDFDGRGLYLRYTPQTGYAAWIAEKGITGADAAADKVTDGTLTPAKVKNPAPAQMFFKYKIDIQQ